MAAIIILHCCDSIVSSFSAAASSISFRRSSQFVSIDDDVTPNVRPRHPSIPLSRSIISLPSSSSSDSENGKANAGQDDECIDVSTDPRLYRVRLSRALGIDWGTDLSFSFVYVRSMEPSGAASLSGMVEAGDQICELRPVIVQEGGGKTKKEEDAFAINLIGASFDTVMGTFASLGRDVREVDLVFFRGTKDELKAACSDGKSTKVEKIMITVCQNKGTNDSITRYIEAPVGCNVRKVLTDNGINVYQSVTRWTNCKGKQLCGTCIVNVSGGSDATNRKSLDEASTLRENPDSYRLSCVTFAYGDVTVETFPPIKAAQWTR